MFSSVEEALGTSGEVDDSLASRGEDWPAAATAADSEPEPDTLRGGKIVIPPPGLESSRERVRTRLCRLGCCCCSPLSVMVANVTALLGTAEGKANAELGDFEDATAELLDEAKAASAEGRVVILGS